MGVYVGADRLAHPCRGQRICSASLGLGLQEFGHLGFKMWVLGIEVGTFCFQGDY